MDREELRKIIYSIFSDTLMVFLALLILPIVLSEYLLDLTSTQNVILSTISWLIYSIFVLEFFLKLAVSEQKISFIRANKLYTFISLVIVISPLLEPISDLFAAAPFLRVLRIVSIIRLSRLTAVLAVSGRARLAWKRINFRTYAIVSSIIVFGFLISFFKPEFVLSNTDQSLLSQLIQTTATIYAIVTGFIISNVWGKYTSLIRSVNSEASSLRNVYLLTLHLTDKSLIINLKNAISEYLQSVIDVFWEGLSRSNVLEQALAGIYVSLGNYNPDVNSKIEIYTNLIDELRKASEGHANIQSLLVSKTPKILWALITVLSSVIIFGFYLINYDNQLVATLTMTLVSTALALVAVIIYDMNDPFKFGFWAVQPTAYLELKNFLKA